MQNRELGRRYIPRQFNAVTHERFLRARRRLYLSHIPGKPTDTQSALIHSLASLEWGALNAEAEGGLVGFREAREHRRLFQRLLADFERSILTTPPAETPLTPNEFFASKRSGKVA
jgi:hypothetical protein